MQIITKQEDRGDSGIVYLAGEVDMHSSPSLRQVLLTYTRSKKPVIVVDMAEVDYIDSSGLATLIECMKNSKSYSGRVILSQIKANVFEVFKLAKLTGFFEITDDIPTDLEG